MEKSSTIEVISENAMKTIVCTSVGAVGDNYYC